MYVNKYILFLFLPFIALHAEEVNFVIEKLKNNRYKIIIDPQKTKFEQIYAPAMDIFINKETKAFELEKFTPEQLSEIGNSLIKNALIKLDRAIRSKIINFMVYDEKNRSDNIINVTVELQSPTIFNKAYRDLYNDVRTFSKELAEEQMQRDKPPVSILDRLKALIWRTKPEEINPEIEPIAMLPDLAPQQWFFQRHPKTTATTGTALTGLAAYLYYKSKYGQ